MKVSTHVALQIISFIISFGTIATNVVPPNLQKYVVLAVSAAQGALAWYNHYYTPNGIAIPKT